MCSAVETWHTIKQARAELVTLPIAPRKTFHETRKGGAPQCARCRISWFTISYSHALAVMMTTVGFVLMMACANVAGCC